MIFGLASQRQKLNENESDLKDWLQSMMSHSDLCIHLLRPSSLRRFKEQLWTGVEEQFLVRKRS